MKARHFTYTRLAIFFQYDGDSQGHVDAIIAGNNNGRTVMASPEFEGQKNIIRASIQHEIPEGPYFISTRTGGLFQAYRLYPDHQLAFTEAAVSDGKGGFKPLPAATGVSVLR